MLAEALPVLPFLFLGALLYTSVGHGGATVYLAVLALAGFALAPLVTTVLVLNVLAAAVAFVAFRRAGHLRLGLLLPFTLASIPLAYLGGRFPLPGQAQEILLAAVLLAAGARFLLVPTPPRVPFPQGATALHVGAPALGGLLGFLAGATGIGGGIFLSPLLVAIGWASVQEAGAVASAFIVVNSLAGLAARWSTVPPDPTLLFPFAAVIGLGALLGSRAGATRLSPRALQVLLGVVLVVAAARSLL